MSSFKDAVNSDIWGVFLNTDEFADYKTVIYDRVEYKNIPVVLCTIKEKDRVQVQSDHGQGLYIVSAVMHCALADLGSNVPEKGMKLYINDPVGDINFQREFYVANSGLEMGMLRIELEAVDE